MVAIPAGTEFECDGNVNGLYDRIENFADQPFVLQKG